jgi:cell division transport system permease protein
MNETARRIFRFGLINYIRNGWLSLATTVILVLTLFIAATSGLRAYDTHLTANSVKDKLDMSIYVKDDPKEEDVAGFVAKLKVFPEVREVVYLDKAKVLEEWNKFRVSPIIKGQVSDSNNPLPRTIKIKAHDPKDLETIFNRINEDTFAQHISRISYGDNRPIIQGLADQSKQNIRNGLIVTAIFVVIAILFVYNTIRLVIRFRQDEIAVMKLVGASDSFVRGPFIVEGALYGLIAGVITLPLVYYYLQKGLAQNNQLADVSTPTQLLDLFIAHLPLLSISVIGGAMVLTILCSWISVHQHLRR